jgi:ribosomal protein S18 acetylase RimI-like enzyme
MAVRPAKASDYEAYCALVREVDELHAQGAPRYFQSVQEPARSRAYFESLLHDPAKALFIAELDGRAAACMHLEARTQPELPFLVQMQWTNVSDIVVGREFMRKGLGRELIEEAKAWAKSKGSKDLRLTVSQFNVGAQAFYEELGFVPMHQQLALHLEP